MHDQVELGWLTGELVNVVQATMQPARVSLWLPDAGRVSEVEIPHEADQAADQTLWKR